MEDELGDDGQGCDDDRIEYAHNCRVIVLDGRHCLECGRRISPGQEYKDERGRLLCEWCYW